MARLIKDAARAATLLVLCCCSPSSQHTSEVVPTPQAATAPQKEARQPQEEITVADFFAKGELPPGYEKAKILKAWTKVEENEDYRLARAEDFEIPEKVKQAHYWTDIELALKDPIEWGEFNGNHGNNFVLIVVDRTKDISHRFGVVLFVERKGKGYDVRWIHRDADFSSGCTVHRHSGDIYLQKFHPDGTSTSCDIKWDRGQNAFVCRI